ncbi:MAG: hypothetical protein WCF44_05040, partial [Candidatus Methylophosphatis roskildensis]
MQDPSGVRNLAKDPAESLRKEHPSRDIPALLWPFEALAEHRDFCKHHPDVDDVLDDLGEIVLRKGAEVIIVPAERMPTNT